MKAVIKMSIIAGLMSLIVGVVSRVAMKPFFLEAQAYLEFSQFCLMVAITFCFIRSLIKLKRMINLFLSHEYWISSKFIFIFTHHHPVIIGFILWR